MATTLNDIIAKITQAQYFNTIMAGHTANKVPVASWTSVRNTGLSLTQISALLFSRLRGIISDSIAGMLIDYATGTFLTLFAKSQYQIDRIPAVFTVGKMVLTSVVTAPSYTYSAGDITAGTPGPSVDNQRLFTNIEGGVLIPGQFTTGGTTGLTVAKKINGVTFQVIVAGLNTSINTIAAVGIPTGGAVTVYSATNAQGAPTSTAAQVRASILGNATAATLVTPTVAGIGSAVVGSVPATSLDQGTLVLSFQATEPGSDWNIPTNSPINLKTSEAGVSIANPAYANSTWITTAGSPEESDALLKQRCLGRWGTIGVGGNADAFTFWATVTPVGYTASPVSQVNVFANYLDTTFAPGAATVVVAGPAGALSLSDIAAVQANLDAPIPGIYPNIPGLAEMGVKYPIACQVVVVTVTNKTITLTGTISILRRSNADPADVQTAVIAALTTYQASLLIGQPIYPQQKVAGVIENAPGYSSAIAKVDLSGMAAQILQERTEYPLLDPSGLSYILVDQ